jgi:uncharacterized phosphatase
MTDGITTTVCMIRHGETDWNVSGRLQGCEDIIMNERGKEQAYSAANYLASFHWDFIYSSSLQRALETAKIIAEKLNLPHIQVLDSLKERNYGAASGLLPEERKNQFPDGIIPGQEEFENLKNRAMNALNSIATENHGKRILVVTHGGFTNALLYAISEGVFESFKTRLKNGCINLLVFHNGSWEVRFYNKTPDELEA